jgi:hypothetical protein
MWVFLLSFIAHGDDDGSESPQQREERALAESVIKKGSVLGDIKRLPQNISPSGGGMGVKGAVAQVQEPQPLPLASTGQMPYTQTEGHMRVVLGDNFEPVTGPTEVETREQIQANILKVLNSKEVGGGKRMAADSNYVDQLTDAAFEERRHPDKYVVYHGTDNNVGFLYDVITEFRKQLMASTHPDTIMMRDIDQAFAELIRETKENGIAGVIRKFRDRWGEINNRKGNYQDLVISANAFLFGSLGMPLEETFRYFFDNYSYTPPDTEATFNHLFVTQLGFSLDFNKYEPLLRESMACDDTQNGRLYQIFIAPDYVDEMTHAAIAGGTEFVTREEESGVFSSKMKHILDDMRTKPDVFFESKKYQDARGRGDRDTKINYTKLQVRLLLKPEWMMNPNIVQIKSYWRCPALQASYFKKLRKLVREDLTQYLLNHREHKEERLAPGSLALLHQYKAALENIK